MSFATFKINTLCGFFLATLFGFSSQAQQRAPKEESSMMLPYEKVITSASKTDDGLFKVHRVGEKYYFEIPDSLLDREILVVTRMAKANNIIGHGGEELNSHVIRWTRKGKKILIRSVSYNNVATDSLPIAQSVRNSNFETILFATELVTLSKDSSVVFEINNLFTKDIPLFGLDEMRRKQFKIGGVDDNRSFIESIRSFPINIEARSVITYKATDLPSQSGSAVSIEINNSFIILPKTPMMPRLLDKRIGYFSVSQMDFGGGQQKALTKTYIERWRIVPKDLDAYIRGELVEPKKKIIYYIDPSTPKKWIKYIKQGAEGWNVCFERAGFKNVIAVKDAPSKNEEPDWSPEDVRYSVIRYYASKMENAFAPRICDPRSGEIIESDIGWYHNMTKLLYDWYLIQTSAANPRARKPELDEDTMGMLIRCVISHEVGHSLGLSHNFASTHAYPVDSLRSASFTKKMGISTSIMDHVRFNYVAQPEDKDVEFSPRIGEYDKYAITWGYIFLPQANTPESEFSFLNKLIMDKIKDPIYYHERHAYSSIDPRSQGEDLGDDAMKASAYGIANLKKILPNLISWTYEPGKDYSDLENLYNQLVRQWYLYTCHVRTNVGGVYETVKLTDQPGSVFVPVPKSIQKSAMIFLQREVFSTPLWLIDQQVLRKFEYAGTIERIRSYQSGTLGALLEPSRLARLIETEAMLGKETYTFSDLLTDIRNSIWSELHSKKSVDVFKRNLQRAYLEKLENLMTDEQFQFNNSNKSMYGFTEINVKQSDIRPIIRGELKMLQNKIKQSLITTVDTTMKNHLEDCLHRINNILESKKS